MEDRLSLKEFTCTVPRNRWPLLPGVPKHSAPWELEVQTFFRTRKPPLREERLLLGCDGEGIGAAIQWHVVGPLASGEVFIRAAAVAMRYRERGRGGIGDVAREMYSRALDQMTGEALDAGTDLLIIGGKIHPDNQGSKRACQALSFEFDGDEDGLELWRRTIDLRGT